MAEAKASASFSEGIMLSTLRANRSWYLAVLTKALLRKLGKPPTRSFWVYSGTRTRPSTCGTEGMGWDWALLIEVGPWQRCLSKRWGDPGKAGSSKAYELPTLLASTHDTLPHSKSLRPEDPQTPKAFYITSQETTPSPTTKPFGSFLNFPSSS